MPELLKNLTLPRDTQARVRAFPATVPEKTGYTYRTKDGYYLPAYETKSSWQVEIVFKGPDARYEPAIALVADASLPDLLESLRRARQIAAIKGKETFEGDYLESINDNLAKGNMSVGVKVASGDPRVAVTIDNGRWAFSQYLILTEADTWIEDLVVAGEAGARMANSFTDKA